ncbi:hypothetical protein [Rhodococcoides kyotonense]|uniref:Uncharacterized protein n=1 Tax=Rhodococcoides kyotonense TaxID=398843 RepID=A0A239H4Q9_9NOCA|nr:hypothetical protein [Rhodococcus kyotonensis]SNS76367.1 hypothetical protein SAMN05421642_10590 [Rhodococcus kyotonensis]
MPRRAPDRIGPGLSCCWSLDLDSPEELGNEELAPDEEGVGAGAGQLVLHQHESIVANISDNYGNRARARGEVTAIANVH